jgi:thiol-disulfide isomerase/thioredoxin
MKKIIYIFCSLLLTASVLVAQTAPRTVVCGQISGPVSPKAQILIKPNPFTNEQLGYEGNVDANGRFSIKVEFPISIEAIFQCGNAQAKLFIEPNDSLYLKGDSNNWIPTLTYSGTPLATKQNEYLRQFYINYLDKNIEYGDMNKMRQLEPPAFRQYTDSLRQVMTQQYDKFKTANAPSAFFDVYAKGQIDYDYAIALLDYPMQHARMNGKQTLDIPNNYYEFLNAISVNNNYAIFTPIYHEFIGKFVEEISAQQVINATKDYDYQNLYADRYDFSKKYLQGEALNYALTKAMVEGTMRGAVEKVFAKIEDFKKVNTRPEYAQVVDMLYQRYKNIAAGQVAPDFAFKDATGKEIKLSSLRGKVVYVDFWATWCGPCKQQFPAERALHKKFEHNPNVVFLTLSTDQQMQTWLNYLTKDPIPGMTCWVGEQYSQVANTYNIASIPRFLLIDKKGNIASSSARRPADARIEADITTLLAQ